MLTFDEKRFFAPKPEEPCCPPPHDPKSFPEKIELTSRMLRDALDRLNMFEHTMTEKYNDLMSIMTQDNVVFKDLMQDAYSDFVSTVRSEINLFETNTETVVTLFKEAINKRLSEHSEAYEVYQKELETMIEDYEQGIRTEVDAISAEAAEAVRYMKTNLNSSVENLLHEMEENGSLSGVIDSDVFKTPMFYGAIGDGNADDTTAFNDTLSATSVLLIDRVYKVDEIVLPNKNVHIIGFGGGKLIAKNGGNIFVRNKRGYKTTIEGLIVEGNGTLFTYSAEESELPAHISSHELTIRNCEFNATTNEVYSIYLYGIREAIIRECTFNGGKGIYTKFAINTLISASIFRATDYIVFSALGSEGLNMNSITAIGSSHGVYCERTTGVQLVNCMIDYCDAPVALIGATDVLISNCYISTRSANPVIHTSDCNGFHGYGYKIVNNIFKANSNLCPSVVSLNSVNYVKFADNDVKGFHVDGVRFADCIYLSCKDNDVVSASGATGYSFKNSNNSDDSTVKIKGNVVNLPIHKIVYARTVQDNSGFLTENFGEVTISASRASVTVNHGLKIKPAKAWIVLTPTMGNLNGANYYVTDVNETSFTIALSEVCDNTIGFAWRIVNN